MNSKEFNLKSVIKEPVSGSSRICENHHLSIIDASCADSVLPLNSPRDAKIKPEVYDFDVTYLGETGSEVEKDPLSFSSNIDVDRNIVYKESSVPYDNLKVPFNEKFSFKEKGVEQSHTDAHGKIISIRLQDKIARLKPFTCRKCRMGFSTRDGLLTHYSNWRTFTPCVRGIPEKMPDQEESFASSKVKLVVSPPTFASTQAKLLKSDPLTLASSKVKLVVKSPPTFASSQAKLLKRDPLTLASSQAKLLKRDPLALASSKVKLVKRGPPQKKFVCRNCGKGFDSEDGLMMHRTERKQLQYCLSIEECKAILYWYAYSRFAKNGSTRKVFEEKMQESNVTKSKVLGMTQGRIYTISKMVPEKERKEIEKEAQARGCRDYHLVGKERQRSRNNFDPSSCMACRINLSLGLRASLSPSTRFRKSRERP